MQIACCARQFAALRLAMPRAHFTHRKRRAASSSSGAVLLFWGVFFGVVWFWGVVLGCCCFGVFFFTLFWGGVVLGCGFGVLLFWGVFFHPTPAQRVFRRIGSSFPKPRKFGLHRLTVTHKQHFQLCSRNFVPAHTFASGATQHLGCRPSFRLNGEDIHPQGWPWR